MNASEPTRASARTGVLSGVGAYVMWGVFPVYFYFLRDISAPIILCHRIVWSCVFLVLLVSLRKEWNQFLPIVRSGRVMLLLSAGAVLIALNWLVFIYSVVVGQVLQSSLGYFINPVLSVALGMVFLGERLRGWQWVALGSAVGAVANLALRGKGIPWIALTLAISFGLYGLVRKRVNINSLHALTIESAILLPLAIVVLWLTPGGMPASRLGLLSLSGILTATPLLLFGVAVRKLQLSTMGFLQYIGPSLQFLMAILFFKEPLDNVRLLSFIFCWVAVAIYVLDSAIRSAPPDVADEPD